jgi:PAS domain S-box-containing protein
VDTMAQKKKTEPTLEVDGLAVERRYAQAVHEIAAGLLKRQSLDELLEAILLSAAELVATGDAFLHLYDEAHKELYIRVGIGSMREAVGFRLPPGEGLAGQVWQSGRPILVPDYSLWEGHSKRFLRQHPGLRSAFGIPLRSGSKTVGVIGLGSHDARRSFGREEMDTVARFAELASIALDNAALQAALEEELKQREKAEAALRESEERYRSYFEDDLSGAYISRPDGALLACNSEFARIFGFSSVSTALGIDLNCLYEKDFPREQFLEALKQTGRIRRLESTMKRIDGSSVQVVANTWGVFSPGGELLEVRGYLMDITEQRTLERQLQQAMKMEAIGTLAGGIAHDFNNLLMAIEGNVSLLLYDLPCDHAHYRFLKNIEQHVKSGAQLTASLLGYARKGRYEVKNVDLNELVKETAETFIRTRKQLTLKLDLDPKLMPVRADPSQMTHTLLNLFINAADAMPERGRLTVETRNRIHRQMKGGPYQPWPGRYVKLSVKDNGVGMTPEVMDRIFDPFFTTKEMGRGTGLGLASVYGIVKGHEGYIEVESTPQKGSEFHIYLPAARSSQNSKEPDGS